MNVTAVYDQAHVRLQELLGRTYNNPLGDAPFPLLRALLAANGRPHVLDAGCGRAQSSRWWAVHAGASVDGFDPSPMMLASARIMVSQQQLEDRVKLHHADIASFSSADRYDLVIAHDVLCYSEQLAPDLQRLLAFLRPGGLTSLTAYHSALANAEMQAVVRTWGIQPPPTFPEVSALLKQPGFQTLLIVDTTRQYRAHWTAVRDTLAARFSDAQRVVGSEETRAFAARIDAILTAVGGGQFGHWWAILASTG